jgi:hypothetical protein
MSGSPVTRSRQELLRALLPFIAALVGFFAGLVAGGLAETLIVPLVLFATGHPHPLSVLDESFRADPLGVLALAMITGYLTTAFFGALAAYQGVRKMKAFAIRPNGGQETSRRDEPKQS